MSYINLRCKTCGGFMSLDLSSKNILCSHCGKSYFLSDLLSENDIKFLDKLSVKELNFKITANSFIKEGDSLIYQAKFDKAEQLYKKAIEIDDKNYRAYLGVVRAKTHNLNLIPDNDDYKYYVKKAIELADIENKIYVKNELSKLILLKQEKKLRDKEFAYQQKKNDKKIISSKYEKLFGKISATIIFAVMTLIFICIFFGI